MIIYKISTLNSLSAYLDLYQNCFENYDKDLTYLNWLYSKNPKGSFVGIDVFDDDILVGQIGGIPINFKFFNNPIKTIVSMNICIRKEYRRGRIFYNLAKRFEQHLIDNNFELIIGIANQVATPAWIRSIKLKYLCQLKTFIGFYDFSKLNILKEDYNLLVEWNEELIKWRCLNPYNKTKIVNFINNQLILAETKLPFVKVYSPYLNNIKIENVIEQNKNFHLKVFVGLSNEINNNFLFRKIPDLLKPSPLNFLYKFLNKEYNLNQSEVFISFLDFDAF